MIVNREYARKYLHDAAIDRQITCFFDFSNGGTRTIVGVVDNVQYGSLDDPPQPQVYVPESQMPYPAVDRRSHQRRSGRVRVRAQTGETKAIDPRLAVSRPRTMDEVFNESLARRRFSMTLIAIFAVSALVLAMVGLYGVIALSVSHHTRDRSEWPWARAETTCCASFSARAAHYGDWRRA